MNPHLLQALATFGVISLWIFLVVRIIRKAYGQQEQQGPPKVAQAKPKPQQQPMRAAKPMFVEAVPQMPSAEGGMSLADIMLDVKRRVAIPLDAPPPPSQSLESQMVSLEGALPSYENLSSEGSHFGAESGQYHSLPQAAAAEAGNVGRNTAKTTNRPTTDADKPKTRARMLRESLRQPRMGALIHAELLRRPDY